MKNGLLIWNVVLTLAAGYLLVLHFKGKSKKVDSATTTANNAQNPSAFRIAYFEMDSVEKNFNMVKDVKAEISKKDEEYSSSLSQLDWTYQKKVQDYQQKSTSMTQSDYEKAQADLKQLGDRLKVQKQDIDNKYQEFVTRLNLNLKKEIEDFIAEYNKTRNYNYIVVYEPGLFYFKDTAYNITADVIKGLNQMYDAKNKKK